MDKYNKLSELKSLFDSGLITETEFSNLKNEILFENSNVANIKSESNELINSNKIDFKETSEQINTLEAGKNNSVFNKGLIIASIIIFIILGIKSIQNSSDKPKTQIEFENARKEFYLSCIGAPNRIKKSEVFDKSNENTCEFTKKYGREFTDWNGVVSSISSGEGAVKIIITSTYKNHPVNYLSETIRKQSPLYNQIVELKEGDIVSFSFAIKKKVDALVDVDDCFEQYCSGDELSCLKEPYFGVDFTNIKK